MPIILDYMCVDFTKIILYIAPEFVIDSSLLEIYLDYIIVCACEHPFVIISGYPTSYCNRC